MVMQGLEVIVLIYIARVVVGEFMCARVYVVVHTVCVHVSCISLSTVIKPRTLYSNSTGTELRNDNTRVVDVSSGRVPKSSTGGTLISASIGYA